MRIEFRALCTHCGIDVAHLITLGGYQSDGLAKQYLGIDIQRLGRSVRE